MDLKKSRVRLTRAESRTRTRAHLIEAAEDVFARPGFHGASVDEVADVAGYTKGAVYSNFASKDELFLAVLHTRQQAMVEFLERLSTQAAVAGEASLALPDLEWTNLEWCLLTFEFWLYALRNPRVGERLAEVYRQFRTRLEPLLAPFVGDDVGASELAAVGIALYEGLALQRHLDPSAVGVDLVGRVFERLRTAAGTP
jgi:AcrR family transcriptional regulator